LEFAAAASHGISAERQKQLAALRTQAHPRPESGAKLDVR